MLNSLSALAPLSRGNACSECRARKVRCDGNRPQCARCKSLEKTCNFPGVLARANMTDRLQRRAIELELQIARLAATHDEALVSHRLFEQFRHFGVLPKKKSTIASPLPFVLAYPWVLPLPNSSPAYYFSASPHGEGSGSPAELISRAVIDQLFYGWRPELGLSAEQSICLYAQTAQYSAIT